MPYSVTVFFPAAGANITGMRLCWIASLWVLACCGADPESPIIVVSEVTRCGDQQPAAQAAALHVDARGKAFFASHPLAEIQNKGGPILSAPRVIAVFFGQDPMQELTVNMLESYGCTSYWREAVNEYGIEDVAYDRSVVLHRFPELDSAAATQTSAFEDWIVEQVESKAFGSIEEEDLLTFFLPPDVALHESAGGFHDEVKVGRRVLPYAVVQDSSTIARGRYALDARTYTTSHELIEAATNPFLISDPAWVGLERGILPPSFDPSVFHSFSEAADACTTPIASLDYPFALSRAYSNRRAQVGADPCDADTPIQRLIALARRDGVDLSTGSADVAFDVFTAHDAMAVGIRSALAVLYVGERQGVSVPLGLTVDGIGHHGETLNVRLELPLAQVPANLPLDARDEIWLTYCSDEVPDLSECHYAIVPILALPGE